MRRRVHVLLLALCVLALSTAAILGGPSCTTIAGLLHLTAMTDEEFAAWYPTAAGQIGAVARQAHRDGDLSEQDAQSSAARLRDFAAGGFPVPASLAELLGVQGWGAVGLELAILDLDAQLDREGGWGEGGKALQRARVVAGALADEFAALGPPGG